MEKIQTKICQIHDVYVKNDCENWDELFIDYDKYQILPLKIEDLIEAEREIDDYLDFITNELVNNFEELYLLERDIDSFYINLRQGKESFEYPPYLHGDYVLFDFSDGNYIFAPPDDIYIYIWRENERNIHRD